MKDTSDEGSGNDSEPEMFDNVLEKTGDGPQLIDQSDLTQSDEEEETPVKPPPKKKLGPKPAAGGSKRKIESDSESSPVKKKVNLIENLLCQKKTKSNLF